MSALRILWDGRKTFGMYVLPSRRKGATNVPVAASHSNIDYEMIQQNAKAIFDTKNALKQIKNRFKSAEIVYVV